MAISATVPVISDEPRAARPAAESGNLVATYHYVRPKNSDGVTGLTPVEFESQIRAIQKRHRIVTAEEYVAFHETERGLALITFDDGLLDQFLAASILDDCGAPGVFYVPMRPYSDETDRWCSQHLLHALADHLGWTELERRVAPHLGDVRIDEEAMNRLYHYETPAKRPLKYALAFAVPQARAARILREVNAAVGLRAEDWFMTPAQLRRLQDAGHALGGHGFDHVPYNTLSPKQQAADIHRATVWLNQLCGALARTFAYPYGRFTRETPAILRACGYTHAFSTADRVDARDVPRFLDETDKCSAENSPSFRAQRGI